MLPERIPWVRVLHVKQISTSHGSSQKQGKKNDLWSRDFHATLQENKNSSILYISSISQSEQD